MAERVKRQSRIEYIDLFRAFGIILMIMGHIGFGSLFDKWIHAFHMPMFFFVSGWFFKADENIGAQIAKKIRSLLLPYVLFELIQWAVLMIFIPEYRSPQTLLYIFTENTYKIPIENGTFGISPIPGAMWFLTAIFFCEVIYILFNKTMGCNWNLHVIVIVFAIVGMLAPKVLPFRLPWALDAAFVGIGLFHIARIVKKAKDEKILNLKLWQALVLGVVISISIMICPKINMRTGNYGWYLPFWINALGAIFAGWNLARFLEKLLSQGSYFHKGVVTTVSGLLKGIGKNSIVYLCLNQAVILFYTKALDLVGLKGIVVKLPILILTLISLFCFEKLICNTKLKIIIGK